jgi:anti-anti-sigma factor
MKTRKSSMPDIEQPAGPVVVEIGRSGDSMPAEELRVAALQGMAEAKDMTLSFSGVNHMDASLLQVLLAVCAEQKMQQRNLVLVNVSPHLRRWFEYAGAAGNLLSEPTEQQ